MSVIFNGLDQFLITLGFDCNSLSSLSPSTSVTLYPGKVPDADVSQRPANLSRLIQYLDGFGSAKSASRLVSVTNRIDPLDCVGLVTFSRSSRIVLTSTP